MGSSPPGLTDTSEVGSDGPSHVSIQALNPTLSPALRPSRDLAACAKYAADAPQPKHTIGFSITTFSLNNKQAAISSLSALRVIT